MTEPQVFPAGQQELKEFPFGRHANVTVWQGIGDAPGSMGAGYATYQGRFDWVLQYDAVYYFLEGTLTITHGERTYTAGVGDVMFLPRHAPVTYESPEGCKIFWAIYPGDWEQASDFSVAERTTSP